MKSSQKIGLAILLSVVGGTVSFFWISSTPSEIKPLDVAQATEIAGEALLNGDMQGIAEFERLVPANHPDRSESLLQLGELATRSDRLDEALRIYSLIPRDGTQVDVKSRFASGEIFLNRGQLQPAQEEFEYGLKLYPRHPFGTNRLSLVLDFSNQRFASAPYLFDLIVQNEFSLRHLLLLGDSNAVHEPTQEVHRDSPDPRDALVNLANARYLIWYDKLDEAKRFIDQALKISPQLLEARIRVGEIALLKGDNDGFVQWHSNLPVSAQSHPVYWLLMGQWAERESDSKGAVRCYWECLRRDCNFRTANYRIGKLLSELQPDSKLQVFIDRATWLQELTRAIDALALNSNDVDAMRIASEMTEKMGRIWEAVAWARAALTQDRNAPWAVAQLQQWGPRIRDDLPRNLPELDPSQAVNLSGFAIPVVSPSKQSSPTITSATDDGSPIRFTEDASRLGIQFTYFNGPDPTTQSGRMFEFTGGGSAVIDYDQDGRPDLYFTQGCEWPPVPGQSKYLDRLYRFRGDHFDDATAGAGLFEDRFGQGASVGDFDQDGFPDIYVANTHVNRLWRNLGDGTFEDATAEAGVTDSEWTTSCLIADLNGDSAPELVDVNYAHAEDLFTKICESEGVARSCSPLGFPSANDQLLVNNGQGTFRNITHDAGLELGEGRGLGIVAYSPGELACLPSLFVANDMTANFNLSNETASRGQSPQFVDTGVLTGLAFDVDGAPQASMGIASADVDGNGLLDFYVTNFHNESNNLYLQQRGGGFIDAAAPSGLRNPSFSMLGFGTQCLDANSDGWPDIFVTNGHVDDFRHDGLPYQMRNQFFENKGSGKFVERFAATLGPFFDKLKLGRGVTKIDWNGDRREDLVVTFLEEPIALLTNQTQQGHHTVSFQLRGTSVDREAIGSIVKVHAGDRVYVSQMTAGDGYMASNERRIVIGLGKQVQIDRVEISWTNGTTSQFSGLSADHDYMIVEGSGGRLLSLPGR